MPKYSPFKSGKFRVTSPFGQRYLNGAPQFHGGIDLVDADAAGVVTAIMGGVVIRSRCLPESSNILTWQWGNYVCVQQDDTRLAYYCHLDERLVEEGQHVKAGAELGIMGNTGYSFGRHLHLEIREGAKSINPAEYLDIPNEAGAIVEMPAAPAPKSGDEPSEWAREATEWAKENGIFIGDENGSFRWHDPITREEAAKALQNAFRAAGLLIEPE